MTLPQFRFCRRAAFALLSLAVGAAVAGPPGQSPTPGPALLKTAKGEPPAAETRSGAAAIDRASTSKKGSLLIFPDIEVRESSAGDVLADTYIQLTNDYPDDVRVLVSLVSEDCRRVISSFVLTQNQPRYWSVRTGKDGTGGIVAAPATLLAEAWETDPLGGERYLRGSLLVWAVDELGRQIRWNHLLGQATQLNFVPGAASEYSPYAFAALIGAHGEQVGTAGQIRLDGAEYDYSFSQLVLEFLAVHSTAFSGGGRVVHHDTRLVLAVNDYDLRQDAGPPALTKARMLLWNEDEIGFSIDACVQCWRAIEFSDFDWALGVIPLGTDRARARIDGVASPVVCDTSPDAISADRALLGVAHKILQFDGGPVTSAAQALSGAGLQAALIQYDLAQPPEEIDGPPVVPGGPVDPVWLSPQAVPKNQLYWLAVNGYDMN